MQSIPITSLVADALSLGPHWIYSQREIAEKFGKITGYSDPAASYHAGKHAGDFTHYGDQTMVLLRSLASHGGFDLESFAADWRAFWENPETQSYRDGATKVALDYLRSGLPAAQVTSPANDIAGAARIAPLFLLKWKSDDDLIAAARAQTGLTHGDPAVIEAAEFFARVTLAVQSGATIPDALRDVASLPSWNAIPNEWFEAAVVSSASPVTDSAATKAHGLTCHVPDAFPAICDLLMRHPDDVISALTANAEAGGDSAARGMMLGMVYGAQQDATPFPAEWLSGLSAYDEIQQLSETITHHV